MTSSYLTTKAMRHLLASEQLQGKVSGFVGLNKSGVKSATIRNSKSLTTYKAVLAIAKDMGVKPESIIQEIQTK
jgi:hypothetical protein